MDTKKTVTSLFMVPLLKFNRETLREMGFINAYIKDSSADIEYQNAIYLLFKPNNLLDFKQFLEAEYERTTNVIDDYDYKGGFIVVVYRLNSKFAKDIELIKKGQYSRTSKIFQQEFPKIIKIMSTSGLKEEVSLQFRVFNKTKDMTDYWEDKLGVKFTEDQEVWHSFSDEKETLSIEKLAELIT